jgi:branched-chain amino acid transport system ATP-binding protein
MPLLEGQNISRFFGGVRALSDVSFHVDEGEILGLIGPNGAGKTTLFNVICGTYPPSSGAVIFAGENISGLKPHDICRKGIARTFQLTRSFGNLSVLENVMIGSLFGKDCCKRMNPARSEAIELLEFGELKDKMNMSASSLIQVDARRLELVRALAAHPRLLFLDEVMAGLNPVDIVKSMDLVQKIRDEKGITILMVEHIMKSVMTISDRIIVLSSGQLISRGTPREVADDPAVIEAYLGGTDELEQYG